MKKIILILVTSTFLMLSSCGTILKWNQVSQAHSGQVDMAVLLLDVTGLFLFVVPGIVFLSVDYYTGTLFLPRGK